MFFIVVCAGIALLTLPPLLSLAEAPGGSTTGPAPDASKTIRIYVDFPGSGSGPCAFDASKRCVDSIGQYVNAFYKYFAGGIGILATVMILWGGFKWMTAAGNASKVGDARDTIYSAIMGLILTFGSYILLNTINPALVNLSVGVNSIGRQELGTVSCDTYPREAFVEGTYCVGGDCCGQIGRVQVGENVISCLWMTCNGPDICARPYNNPGLDYECLNMFYYCQDYSSTEDWCELVDRQIADQRPTSGTSLYNSVGCGFDDREGAGDRCVVSHLLSEYFERYTMPGYDDEFVDCFTPEAKDICWKEENGQPVAKDCGFHNYCRSPQPVGDLPWFGDFPRAVVGADGACRKSSAGTYECWTQLCAQSEFHDSSGGLGTPGC